MSRRMRDVEDPRTRHVYVCLSLDGTPLYVGQTMHVPGRMMFHGHYSSPSLHWYYHCSQVVVGPGLPGAVAARAAEKDTIRRLRPVFNTHHNPTPRTWTASGPALRAYGSFPEIAYVDAEALERWLSSLPTERSGAA